MTKSLRRLLLQPGPLASPNFEPGEANLEQLKGAKILVIGAGGLGCELLKDLAYSGFCDIHVIDMDTIDLSNLNRQFLFRSADIGKSKAEVAAAFINKRVPSCKVTPHCCMIQDKGEDFYRGFNIIICGLDSIIARRWINAMVCGLLEYDDEGNLNMGTIKPIIDGGTEGLSGNARVILPGLTPCVECTINLYPPAVNFPLCTIAHTPRLPEHCVEYVRLILWAKEKPFGEAEIDGDNPDHVMWIFEAAEKRAAEFKIAGVTYRLAQGVIKRIIPAVASTNAVIAAMCSLEAFKLATDLAVPMNNYANFSASTGVYMGVVEMERREDCPVCQRRSPKIEFTDDSKLQVVYDQFINDPSFQMKSPSLTASGKTLYMANIPSLEEKTRPNLKKTLKELGLQDGDELVVADPTTPAALTFVFSFTPHKMETDGTSP